MIGAGRLGASLALALRHSGQTLVGFSAASAAGRTRAEDWLGMRAMADVSGLVALAPELYVICVPDACVAAVAAELATRLEVDIGAASSAVPLRPVVAHTSGATSVTALAPCERAGAAALVFHPLQTFPEPLTGATRFSGAGLALTPGPFDADAAGTMGMRLADLLEMRPFFLADEKRTLYHAAASVACNYLVTLEYVARELFVQAGVPERAALSLFLPLVRTTLENLAARGPVDALTGPLSRGDEATIAAHLYALASEAPATLPLYRILGLATLDLVAARGEVAPEVVSAMRALLLESRNTVPAST